MISVSENISRKKNHGFLSPAWPEPRLKQKGATKSRKKAQKNDNGLNLILFVAFRDFSWPKTLSEKIFAPHKEIDRL
jgi:hypothetical protein